VELLYFKGDYVQPFNILEWSTASEIQSDYFTIEKSADGIDFQKLETIKAAGTSNSVLVYRFNDENPRAGNNYYRLKQTDINGQFQYFPVISVYSKEAGIEECTFGPNPVNDFLNIFYSIEKNGWVEMKILSMEGYVFYSRSIEGTKGLNTITISDLDHLHPGIYNLCISSDHENIFKRIVKM